MLPYWTPVALSRDLAPLVVMPVVVDGAELALWRSASGRIAAWADRCPHRGMRLSHGFVRGEALSCIYHGWSYAQSGQCQRIPAHPDLEPPEAIRVPVHRAMESGGVIWVALAEPAALPPALAGLVPLRSVTLDAPFDPAAAGLAESGGAWRGTLAGVAVAVLVQPLPENRCVLHVLADGAATPAALVDASRGVETLRRQAEEALA
ncbi:Rieske 2Fe-2S domain-containing protein [Paragemmobacter straminiformis]|uniref:Rieske 2Fe-2S domain-containing protein n=1 Tax=Paragemmobacter straminiformis TaxID=2045119 RepID=A0A842IF24_9RHOB|nr:Rieske 2Fe-2S domain-containing protein [Gemmobacter straminiformis]MBC2837464.1 Rieske 2Fe-2S domain-containing protein [Gemmobacter straminiformis]